MSWIDREKERMLDYCLRNEREEKDFFGEFGENCETYYEKKECVLPDIMEYRFEKMSELLELLKEAEVGDDYSGRIITVGAFKGRENYLNGAANPQEKAKVSRYIYNM